MSIYLNDWADDGEKQMLRDFNVTPDAVDGANVIVASYTYEDYSGDAYVLFERDGKLFEVHGSHCSCYGLEDQWEPEETTKEAIVHRIKNGNFYEADNVKNVVLAAISEDAA